MIRMEQRGAVEEIERLQERTDEQLENETKYKAMALAILGSRAAERYDAKTARGYFQRAIVAAPPQQRMMIRRMSDASLALAERRSGDLKEAVQKLGQDAPSGRQLFMLRLMGIVAPPPSAGILRRIAGIFILIGIIIVILAIGFGIVMLVSLPFGGVSPATAGWVGALLVVAVIATMTLIGRRRQRRAKAAAGR